MSNNTLLAIKVKAFVQSYSLSLLYCVFLEHEHSQLILHYCAVAEGDELFHTDISEKPRLVVNDILKAKDEYSVDHDAGKKLLDTFVSEWKEKIITKIIANYNDNNSGETDYFLKKVIDHAFQVDDTKIEHKSQRVSHGEIEIINAFERSQMLTVVKRNEIAAKYVGSDPAYIKDVVNIQKEDTVVTVSMCGSKGQNVAAMIVLFNRLSGKLLQCITIAGNLNSEKFSSAVDPVDLYHAIVEMSESEASSVQAALAIKKRLEMISVNDYASVLAVDDSERFSNMLSSVLKGSLDFDSIKAYVMPFNSIIADIIFSPNLQQRRQEQMEDDPTAKIPSIPVDLAVSPTKGVKLSELQPGNRIYVIINASNPAGKKVVSQLNLMDDNNRVKPVGAVVESVVRDRKNNFIVLVRLSSKLIGKAVEEEDIKVKSGDPVADKQIKKSSSALIIGLITGFFVLVIIAVAFAVFV